MSGNPLKLKCIHHVELLVGNAKQTAFYYRNALGFSQIAYAGLETGQRDRASYALQQGRVRLLLTSPLSKDGPISDHLKLHPHGPHPGAVEKSLGKKSTDELAVMADTFRPLQVAKHAVALEDGDYHRSWLE